MTEQRRFGRYLLQRTLASGGMGEVWIAHDEMLQRQVAIKLLHPSRERDDALLQRFEQEARMVAQLQHPHVVRVYDYGISQDDAPYIVMELLEGEDLSRLLKRAGRLTLSALAPLVTQAAKGLHAAHRAGIIHHDLKPANLFLARQGGEPTVKVLDFGIATMRPLDAVDDDGQRAWIGTPAYMSPEQLRTGPLEHRTDLWSLGVVAYEALTGKTPFPGKTLTQVAAQVVAETPIPPSQHVSSLGPGVDAFFERALAKAPGARFSSALELAAAFSALDRPQAGPGATILVVDDEPDLELLFRQHFRRQLRSGRYELIFAQDGQEALTKLAARPDVDVVLTDLNMPGMDGLTLLEHLGQAGPALRAVVISAYGDMPNIRAAMNAGAYDFLTKPVDFADVRATIDKALRDARELRRALRSIEENDSLRLFVDDALLERLLPLLKVSREVSGERIEATVISIDVHDTGRRVEQEDPSAVFDMLNRSFDIVVPVMNTWQGVVMRFVGDAALVLFQGEDHLSRASSACFAARAALSEASHQGGPSPQLSGICIGLDSGWVLSGSIGSRTIQRLDYAVLGPTVSRALALERHAAPGQILVREPIAEQLASLFQSRRIEGEPDGWLGALYNIERRGPLSPTPSSALVSMTTTMPMDETE